ncbi:cobyric acid synthase [Slackia heliotrinireducens]|uniref:cobyric acid synthase n=1 Tax=Slackia heliotrinireducens TaxID=84110 RepID=UPI0033160AC1
MAKAIMVQGTMSGAGKSLIVAALCRIFAQDGLRAAPFKSQNMALNSCITDDGLEMGRAQVMQAQAAGIRPEAAMNPILLKPTSDVGSQVIVEGKPLTTMSAKDYFAFKKSLVPQIMKAYRSLDERFDVIVIEGAGSPAEVNLKTDDIVNMGMAKMAFAPVLLVGDIDRGGVFAQLIGTIDLLDEDERDLVKATVVNKFRGDVSILKPGLDIIEEKTGVPVAGVVPYVRVDIDDEDSLSDRLDVRTAGQTLDIAVVRLPHVSNFTDFIALDAIEGVGVRYVTRARELGEPDLVIVPGTKNTIDDLRWMRESGMEAAVVRRARAGTPVLGICGGYQILGVEVRDPDGVEGGGTLRGLGLLPVVTEFSPEKRQVLSKGTILQVEGVLAGMSGATVEGYEIHMGSTVRTDAAPGGQNSAFVTLADAAGQEAPHEDGCCCNNVYGTYLHGLFDTQESAQALVSSLLAAKGLDAGALQALDMAAYREEQYDILADTVRESLDMDLVYRILEEGV